jgi:ketosteroid isomerase-like protein
VTLASGCSHSVGFKGRGLESEAEVESPVAYVIELKDGRITRVEDFFDPSEALKAAGLSE